MSIAMDLRRSNRRPQGGRRQISLDTHLSAANPEAPVSSRHYIGASPHVDRGEEKALVRVLCVIPIDPNSGTGVAGFISDLDIGNLGLGITACTDRQRKWPCPGTRGAEEAIDGVLALFESSGCHGGGHILNREKALHRKFGRWSMSVAKGPAAAVAALIDGSIRSRKDFAAGRHLPMPTLAPMYLAIHQSRRAGQGGIGSR